MNKRILRYASGLIVAVAASVFAFTATQTTFAGDCDDNAIIRCGTSSVDTLRSTVSGSSELQAIFGHYNLGSNVLGGAIVKTGSVTSSGQVIVNGEVVATGAQSVGRQNMSGSSAVNIAGKTYYQRPTSVSFRSSSLTAFVFLDSNGKFIGAVISACGNPVVAVPKPKPVAACQAVEVQTLAPTLFRFVGRAAASDGAVITGYTFTIRTLNNDGGIGSEAGKITIQTSATSVTTDTQTYTLPGTYQVNVVAHTSLGDRTDPQCNANFFITGGKLPREKAIEVEKLVDGVEHKTVGLNQEFTYQIKVTATKGPVKNIIVSDDAPAGVTFIRASEGTITDNKWGLTIPVLGNLESKTYTITAKVPAYKAGTIKNTVCVDSTIDIPGNPDDCDDATVDVPEYVCEGLTIQKISRSEFKFIATHRETNATYLRTVFIIRSENGTEVARVTDADGALNYTRTNEGKYTVEAQVVFNVNGQEKTASSDACKKSFEVTAELQPSVTIDKKVDGVEHKTVGVNQEFTYQIRVTNTGNTDLKNVVVSDQQPAGVTFIRASEGTINGDTWKTTVTELKKGTYKDFTITAKIPAYKAGTIKNTACVDAPEVTGTPDDCDDATVDTKEKDIRVCELATGNTITIKETDFDETKHSKDFADCVKISVCKLADKTIITIFERDFDASKHSKDLNDCKEEPTPEDITVCELETGKVITIKETAFDETKHSKDLNDCKMITVCKLDDKTTIVIREKDFDESKHSRNMADCAPVVTPCPIPGKEHLPMDSEDCKETPVTPAPETPKTPPIIASTGPEAIASGLVGSSALGLTITSFLRSRRSLRSSLR